MRDDPALSKLTRHHHKCPYKKAGGLESEEEKSIYKMYQFLSA